MARLSPSQAGGANILAFLDMIAVSEISKPLLALSDDGYNVLVGSTAAKPHLFPSYADHPDVLVTVNSAGLQSTAAGRYQFLHRTWADLRTQLSLTDFGPENQDRGCIELLRESKAIARIQAGDIRNAVFMCAHIWASLPGANYGQHENNLDALVGVYYEAHGRYV